VVIQLVRDDSGTRRIVAGRPSLPAVPRRRCRGTNPAHDEGGRASLPVCLRLSKPSCLARVGPAGVDTGGTDRLNDSRGRLLAAVVGR